MRRLTLTVLLAIGVALIVAPLSMSMFSRASGGEKMVNAFRPLMQPASVQTTADYYYGTFTKLRPIALAMNQQTIDKFNGYLQGIKGMGVDAQKFMPMLAQFHITPQQFATQFPAMAAMLQNLPQMQKDFAGLLQLMGPNVSTFKNVPPGLDWYRSLVQTMQQQTGNYAKVDALPPFKTFPWFFLIPGILIVLSALYLLVGDVRPELVWPRLASRSPVAH
jgi:hypothetical protein